MQLLVPQKIAFRLVEELIQADKREIGGILMGEHVSADIFRVREFTTQRKGGTFATFVRIVAEALAPLRAFFDNTKHDYKRFNYLGEWHSHHSFELRPSAPDHATMSAMVNDSQLGAHFLVLLLVRLDQQNQLESSVTIYQPNRQPFFGYVIPEPVVNTLQD